MLKPAKDKMDQVMKNILLMYIHDKCSPIYNAKMNLKSKEIRFIDIIMSNQFLKKIHLSTSNVMVHNVLSFTHQV